MNDHSLLSRVFKGNGSKLRASSAAPRTRPLLSSDNVKGIAEVQLPL